ncbi:vegetative cell wall protein gp1-like [Oryza sativa Japonica Group]|uniref:vegetative cell wall protein gp1-like n=1 Tax=Oryza sativa subsp. japonica TaxID=39947 RepID=UPI00339CE435
MSVFPVFSGKFFSSFSFFFLFPSFPLLGPSAQSTPPRAPSSLWAGPSRPSLSPRDADRWAPPVGPVSFLQPAPPRPLPPPRPRLRLLRATSATPARAPRPPRPLPSLSRPRPRPRWPGFDFRIPPLSPPPLPTLAGEISPLPATSGAPLPYLGFPVAPSRFFPISPNSLVLPIAPAPCNHPPPPFPLLRRPLGSPPHRAVAAVGFARLSSTPAAPFPLSFVAGIRIPSRSGHPEARPPVAVVLPWLAVAVRRRLPPRRPPSVRLPLPSIPLPLLPSRRLAPPPSRRLCAVASAAGCCRRQRVRARAPSPSPWPVGRP